jgi:hypothetical protein
MGLWLVAGDSSLKVLPGHEDAFMRALSDTGFGHLCTPRRDERGRIVGLDWIAVAAPEPDALETLRPHVAPGSWLGFESMWGDDAWRWVFARDGMVSRRVRCGERAR